MGRKESSAREGLHKMLGTGYIRGLHVLPRASLMDIKEEDEEMDEVPDFVSLITEGMQVEDRLEQLQYVTEEDGSFAQDEDGNLIPRGQLPVRKYASDPEGPLAQLEMPEVDTVEFLDFEKVLDLVIKAEKKIYGLGGKKPSKTKKKTEVKKAAAATNDKKEMDKMPATKPRIMLRRPGGAPVAKAGAKKAAAAAPEPKSNGEDKTPGKVKAKVAKAATPKRKAPGKVAVEPSESNGATETEGAGLDLSAIEAIVEAKVSEATKALDAKLDAILEALGEGPGGRSVAQTMADGVTVLHDALQQKISNAFFGLASAVDEDGQPIEFDGPFPFLDPEDGRDRAQNLLEGKDPVDIISFYLDGAEEEEEGEEEGEEDE